MGYLREIKTEFLSSKGKKEKEELAGNLAGVITQLLDSVTKANNEISGLKNQKDAKMNQLNAILQQEKDHFTKVKQFEDACEENERLLAQYKQQRKGSVKQSPQHQTA